LILVNLCSPSLFPGQGWHKFIAFKISFKEMAFDLPLEFFQYSIISLTNFCFRLHYFSLFLFNLLFFLTS
jgi:hypothetical protein